MKALPLVILVFFATALGVQGYLSSTSLNETSSVATLCFIAAGSFALAFVSGLFTFSIASAARFTPLVLAAAGSLAFAIRTFVVGAPDDAISIVGALIVTAIVALPTIWAGAKLSRGTTHLSHAS